MATFAAGGEVPNLIVFNTSSNWTGNWTSAGVARIEMDVQGPASNSFPLAMRLGIVESGALFGGGGGEVYITEPIAVPSDGVWHRISFDVLAPDFIALGDNDIEDALADVAHFRIFHNPLPSFAGASPSGGGEFFLDNIQALSAVEPPTTTGDYNENGVVDAADYVVWRNTLGGTVENEGDGADGNRSGMVDPGDYDFWYERFGNVVSQPGLVGAVPEPTSGGCGFIALIVVSCRMHRRVRPFRRARLHAVG